MPRLFTAIEIPEQAAAYLATLRGGLPGARWIDTQNYHITLRFIGDIDRHTAGEIADALGRVRRAPVTIRIDGLNAFGGNKPHSVHARVARSSGLLELQAEHERIMQRIGLRPEGRKFAPHVTLARLRGVRGADVAGYLALRGNFSLPPFEAKRFVLYSSRASVGGGPYVVEEAYELPGDAGQPRAGQGQWLPAAQ